MSDFVHEDYTIRLLSQTDNVRKFSSSARNLNIFLRDIAFNDMQENETKTYVMASNAGNIVGFYTVSISSAQRNPCEKSQGPTRRQMYPAFILAKFAVVEDLQEKGIGTRLIGHLKETCLKAQALVGGVAIIVDTQENDISAYMFYENRGFKALTSTRLIFPLK